jgi:uncharacterized membrane protein YgcG
MRELTAMPNWTTGVLLTLGVVVLATGCHENGYVCPTDRCADIPCGAIPRPAGVYSCQWQTEQKLRAEQDKYVIYQYEWYAGGKRLGPDGRRHIETIATRLAAVPYPVIVEKSDDSALDETRRKYVVETLTLLGATDAERRVILGYSEAEGFDGAEAVRLGNRAPSGPATGPAGGGFGPSNAGAGAGTNFGGGFGGSGFGGGGLSGGGGMGVY